MSRLPEARARKSRRFWLTAVAEIIWHNQSHWWVIPASLLLFGVVTAVQLAPYQAQSSGYGDGSLVLFGNANLRYYLINPLYLFIVANIGGQQRHDDLVLYRLRSRTRLWTGKAFVFGALTFAYWLAAVLFAEMGALPFVNEMTLGSSGKLLACCGWPLDGIGSQTTVWFSTVWFVLLSWLALGGVALVVSQLTQRAGLGFVVALALSLSGLFVEQLSNPGLLALLDMRAPMLFVWSGQRPFSFLRATAYWGVWYLALCAVVVWHLDRSSAAVFARVRSWLYGVWLIMQMSFGRLWLLVVFLALISVWMEADTPVGSTLDAFDLVAVPLAPIVSLGGPALDAPLFSLMFLRWFLIFLLFLFLLGETAVATLWQQHVFFLPRLGSRTRWWLANVAAVAGLACFYLAIYVGINWLANPAALRVTGLPLYVYVFLLYWLTLTTLGSWQLLLLLFLRSRSQTLLVMILFLLTCWVLGSNFPALLAWLPVAQTAVLARLLQHGRLQWVNSLPLIGVILLASIKIGLIVCQRYEFTGHLTHQ